MCVELWLLNVCVGILRDVFVYVFCVLLLSFFRRVRESFRFRSLIVCWCFEFCVRCCVCYYILCLMLIYVCVMLCSFVWMLCLLRVRRFGVVRASLLSVFLVFLIFVLSY